MSIRKLNSGKWQLNIRPGGRAGKQIIRVFKSQAEAKRYEIYVRGQQQQNSEWTPEKKDTRRLSALIDEWHQLHGIGLAAGADTYSRLKKMCEAMGNPSASTFRAEQFAEYRKKRLDAGISQNTMNREFAYLKSVFAELMRIGKWKKTNPLQNIRKFKIQEPELTFLSTFQIESLLCELQKSPNPHVMLIAKICLASGSRWSESENLQSQHVTDAGVQFVNTKGKKTRTIPISSELKDEISKHIKAHHSEKKSGARYNLFEPSYNAFRYAIQQTGIELPDGQLTHVLRHSFASHFMSKGGNILTLQRVLGHGSLTMTMRYAHLAPDHMREVVVLNPLSQLSQDLPGATGYTSAEAVFND